MSEIRFARKHKTTADRISNLPENVTQQILECLPLQEAARTSILSSYWRHKWASISKLVLDEKFFNSISMKRKEISYSKVVNHILLSHVGPICKFVLYLPSYWFPKEKYISRWIRYVRGHGVEELTLQDDRGPKMYLPTSLFSCKDLTHLTLIKCKFRSLPPTFRGFPCLITLRWKAPCYCVKTCKEVRVLETLISKCPKLQRLCLNVYELESSLTVCAPNLQLLHVKSRLLNLSLEGPTSIRKLALDLACRFFQRSKHVSDFFSTLLKVEKLVLIDFIWRALEFYEFISPRKFPNELERLRTVELVRIPLYCRFSMSLLLCLLASSPHLERLCIEAALQHEKVSDEQSIQIDDTCILPCLRNVQLLGISGLRSEMQLIKFLLACSPVLEKMNIKLSMEMGGAEEKLNFDTELIRYCRASPNAEINIKTKSMLSVGYTFCPLLFE